jgi:hypothetical protein
LQKQKTGLLLLFTDFTVCPYSIKELSSMNR